MRGLSTKKKLLRWFVAPCLLILTGCGAAMITPPPRPMNPQVVYLCDYGIHSSLLMPTRDGKYVEFLYGDWNWAALGHNSPIDAVGALFFSQQATLGRRYIELLPGDKMPIPIDPPRSELPIVVNGDDCDLVVQKLQLRWEGHRQTAIATGSTLSYVKDEEPYGITHDCNNLTVECLRDMGCTVNGDPFYSNFKIADPLR